MDHPICWRIFQLALIFVSAGFRKTAAATFIEHGRQLISSAPIPAPFPNVFQIDFVTNITWNQSTDFVGGTASGRLFYDWTTKQQRIDHGSGSYECQHFYFHDGPCSLIFVPDWGMYRILLQGEDNNPSGLSASSSSSSPSFECCLDIPNIVTPPPNWAELGDPTYNGVVYDSFSKTNTHEWIYNKNVTTAIKTTSGGIDRTCQQEEEEESSKRIRRKGPRTTISPASNPAKNYHTTRQVVDGEYKGRPTLFSFPSAEGRQDYHYLVETLKDFDPPMDPSIFSLPDGCLKQFCKCQEDGVSQQG